MTETAKELYERLVDLRDEATHQQAREWFIERIKARDRAVALAVIDEIWDELEVGGVPYAVRLRSIRAKYEGTGGSSK